MLPPSNALFPPSLNFLCIDFLVGLVDNLIVDLIIKYDDDTEENAKILIQKSTYATSQRPRKISAALENRYFYPTFSFSTQKHIHS